jgi:hypothetical protein
MERTVVLLRWYAGGALVILTLSLFSLAGCADSSGDGGKAAGKYGLDQSELIMLKKANKNLKDFKKALLQQKIEKLQEEGVIGESATSGKKTKKAR